MINRTFEEISEKYELEIDKIVRTIKRQKAERVLLQFPEFHILQQGVYMQGNQ